MKQKLKNLDTAIRQWLADRCETRSQNSRNIKAEMFWDKLGIWFLRL
jgi:hypothetical protein